MSTSCKKCSKCCQNIILPLGMNFDKDDIRWIEYHNLKVIKKDNKLYIKIENKCSKLESGKCSIYKNRPEVCQIFVCE